MKETGREEKSKLSVSLWFYHRKIKNMCYTRIVTKEKGNCSVTDKRYNIYKEDITMAVVKLTTDTSTLMRISTLHRNTEWWAFRLSSHLKVVKRAEDRLVRFLRQHWLTLWNKFAIIEERKNPDGLPGTEKAERYGSFLWTTACLLLRY